ncbi:RNA-binding domain-containing protein [Piedraia hortae CBS 480.64]|uniref:Multiple RNA-binding domain-containing protein 1 n=1 Tax=Piedraia hortae CBS 480.64 TaxID=1314780 RepID=A0A6A7BT41_9PEZI|nr:RNA-binding domain-containing protein [Piedraia hortae CBS 480.64]
MDAQSSRIFVNGLPPSFTEKDLRDHFGQGGRPITDAKIFPTRRIGFVGYRSPEAAQEAVKHFNRNFIRLSRISVEIARPVHQQKSEAPPVVPEQAPEETKDLKRKREDDTKLKEFLETMRSNKKTQTTWGEDTLAIEEEAPVKDLSDDEYEDLPGRGGKSEATGVDKAPVDTSDDESEAEDGDSGARSNSEKVRKSMRLFVRNLPYDLKPNDLVAYFNPVGDLEEVHVPLDRKTSKPKGFAFAQFNRPRAAEEALKTYDGQTFQGRLLHIVPARAKRGQLDEAELAKLPRSKQELIRKRQKVRSSNFNWNALYLNADAVVTSTAERLGIAKSELLDPTSSNAAVIQAHAETESIRAIKAYFEDNGVDLQAFKHQRRGDTALLIKNIPHGCREELLSLLEAHGEIKRFLMPSSGLIAIAEYALAAQCASAYKALAYRRLKNSMLKLEMAPKDLFTGKEAPKEKQKTDVVPVPSTSETASLFVRNLNFSTTSAQLEDTFRPFSGFLAARVKTKTDPKKPGQILSMGYGFVEFRSAQQARGALQAMKGYVLHGHHLQIQESHKDVAEERRKADAATRQQHRKTKIIIKNLPFELGKREVRDLFGKYGQLQSVRMPKKLGGAARGFAFANFATPKEAERAMEALRNTHFLGRKLVLEYAQEDAEDAETEIERMQQKIGAQTNKVALQKLTGGNRKRFMATDDTLA